MGGRLNDVEGLKVPGPGVNYFLFSLMIIRNMITHHGWKEEGNIH